MCACVWLSLDAMPAYDQTRTLRRHQTAIREHLKLWPRHSREARKVAVRAVFEAAQVPEAVTAHWLCYACATQRARWWRKFAVGECAAWTREHERDRQIFACPAV